MPTRESAKNPLREIRAELGVSQTEFAAACEVSPRTVSVTELGGNQLIPEKILTTLAQLGYDADAIREDYAKFLAARRAEALHKLEARRPHKEKASGDK